MAVGAGHRRGQDIATSSVLGHGPVGDDDVTCLAVLAHDP